MHNTLVQGKRGKKSIKKLVFYGQHMIPTDSASVKEFCGTNEVMSLEINIMVHPGSYERGKGL